MNFVIKLSKFTDFNTVIMVVNLMSKKTHFTSIYIIVIIKNIIRLFLYNI